ncbi:MAG: glycine--tRNA ligase subunit beta, partial [Gammaproteobacteria bacterium]
DGNPTKAAEGFARSCGTTVDQLDKLETDKGSWLFYKVTQKGKSAAELIPGFVQQSLDALPIPKRMRWGSSNAEFVRPVHWILMMMGEEIIETTILDIKSSNFTRGHRFYANEDKAIKCPKEYVTTLEQSKVIPDFAERREIIKEKTLAVADSLNGKAIIDEDLLDEVTALVEWPIPVAGDFEESFLEVPQEALISSMQDHQKYFPVVDKDGKLLPHFITVSNIDSTNPEAVKSGNERVIRPRLADAAFFWSQDRKNKLESNIEKLKTVVFQNKLGTVFEKSCRVAELAKIIAERVGADPENAARAAVLAKCDLMSDMVGEFPDLQGIMGRYYATLDGESTEVANAIEQHYLPKFAGDSLPTCKTASALALADRVDTICGIFGIGQLPTGDKDPFALRRAALGIIRILTENKYNLDLKLLLTAATAQLPGDIDQGKTVDEVYSFIIERLKGYYADQGVSANVFDAVQSTSPAELTDFEKRINACIEFSKLEESESLAAANKRIKNILKKVEGDIAETIDINLLQEDAEKALADAVAAAEAKVAPLFEEREYTKALSELATLRTTVDTFFDNVMVMAEDAAIKGNRIAMLNKLSNMFMQAADISRL